MGTNFERNHGQGDIYHVLPHVCDANVSKDVPTRLRHIGHCVSSDSSGTSFSLKAAHKGLHAGIMGFQYTIEAIPTKDAAIITFQFSYQDSNDDVPQLMTTEWFVVNSAHLSFGLWSDSHQLIHERIFLPVDFDGTSNIKLPGTEAGCCVATVKLHKGGSMDVLSSRILIPPTVEHTITSFYIEC